MQPDDACAVGAGPCASEGAHAEDARAKDVEQRAQELRRILAGMGRVAVAFSGGVDSALLLAVAHEVLGDDAFALTADSVFFPARETEAARAFCADRGIRQQIVTVDALSVEGVAANPSDRCYWCKQAMMGTLLEAARAEGAVLVEGSNATDAGSYRPGARALAELGVRSPLAEAGLSKADIRALSYEMGLPTWNKPSFACLATRFPYGETLTEEGLARVAAAEAFLLDAGFSQVRVRAHGDVARLEVAPNELPRLLDASLRQAVYDAFRELGFSYVAADLLGYRTGSADETLERA